MILHDWIVISHIADIITICTGIYGVFHIIKNQKRNRPTKE